MSNEDILNELKNINKRLDALELEKSTASGGQTEEEPAAGADHQNSRGVQYSDSEIVGPPDTERNFGASHRPEETNYLKKFESIRERLSKISLPNNLKLVDNSAEIKTRQQRDSKSHFKNCQVHRDCVKTNLNSVIASGI